MPSVHCSDFVVSLVNGRGRVRPRESRVRAEGEVKLTREGEVRFWAEGDFGPRVSAAEKLLPQSVRLCELSVKNEDNQVVDQSDFHS